MLRKIVLKVSWQFIGNKAKGRISKRVFQENKARQIFRKNKHLPAYTTEHFLAPDRVRIGGKRCSFFTHFTPVFHSKATAKGFNMQKALISCIILTHQYVF